MSYTNAQLVRLLVGDVGIPVRDVTSGDGSTREFFLSVVPILPDSQVVYVSGVAKAETADYTIDDDTGRLAMIVAPPNETGNLVVTFRGVQIPEPDVVEACRQEGLTATATALEGEPTGALRAALMLARSMAARLATVDATLSARWSGLANDLALRTSQRGGLVPVPTTKVDGYSQDVTSTDVQTQNVNPRRRYYGEEDRLP